MNVRDFQLWEKAKTNLDLIIERYGKDKFLTKMDAYVFIRTSGLEKIVN